MAKMEIPRKWGAAHSNLSVMTRTLVTGELRQHTSSISRSDELTFFDTWPFPVSASSACEWEDGGIENSLDSTLSRGTGLKGGVKTQVATSWLALGSGGS